MRNLSISVAVVIVWVSIVILLFTPDSATPRVKSPEKKEGRNKEEIQDTSLNDHLRTIILEEKELGNPIWMKWEKHIDHKLTLEVTDTGNSPEGVPYWVSIIPPKNVLSFNVILKCNTCSKKISTFKN